MFVLDLTYTAPEERIDALLEDHVAWLNKLYSEGVALASGRKNPRDGGVIIAVGGSLEEMQALTATDPFVAAGVCTYTVTEFLATKTGPQLAEFRQELPD